MRKARSFRFVNKQQPGDWHPASLGVWWNKCILIRTETWQREADLQPNRTSELWGGIFFFFSFRPFLFFPETGSFFFSQQDGGWWWYHYTPLHYKTLHHGAQSNSFHAHCCQYHWRAGLYCTKSWKLINSASLTSQPCESGISLWAESVANIFRAPYQDRSSTYPKNPWLSLSEWELF